MNRTISDSLLTAEIDDMSRAFDPTHHDDSPTSIAPELLSELGQSTALPTAEAPQTPRRPALQHVVCPFCGVVNDDLTKACRQCGMENTQATRQATRSKIGPWFVWQARNPSAPGMNWATLMSLVEKGRITPRSVLRGPTTAQLWRFAARVKGVSREFGTCWHCGAAVTRLARVCASCKRLQQPPMNPDALLETVEASPTRLRGTVPAVDHRAMLAGLRNEPVRREIVPPQMQVVAPQEPLVSAVSEIPMPASISVIDLDGDALPSALHMRTFQMGEDDELHASKERHTFRRIVMAGFVALIVLAGSLYFSPQVRPYYVRWYQQVMSWFSSGSPAAAHPKGVSNSEPPPVQRTTRLMTVDQVPTPVAPTPAPTSDPVKTTDIHIEPGNPTPAVKPALQETEPENAEHRAWALREGAIASEQRGDFADAVKKYEWIVNLRLPEGVGPSDVESRLQQARLLIKKQPAQN